MSQAIDIRDAFFDELYRIAQEDPEVVFMTADMGAFSLERFRADFPERFINVGISEQNLISAAAGMALAGKRVFVYAIIPFVTLRCLEQIKVDLCVMNLPVTVIGAGAGFTYSSDGPTHHAIEDVAVMRAFPNLTIYNPGDQVTASAAARSAYQACGPVYVRLDKGSYPVLHALPPAHSAGMATIRHGRDLLILATGCMTHSALEIAGKLAGGGIEAEVADIYRLKPLDRSLLESIRRHHAVVTLEEHNLPGGLGSAVLELISDAGLERSVKRLGIADCYPQGYGDREWMRSQCSLGSGTLLESVRAFHAGLGEMSRLAPQDFASLLNTPLESFSAQCLRLMSELDFRYRVLNGDETKELALQILQKLESGKMSVAGSAKLELWEKGWGENYEEFLSENHSLDSLKPKYYRPHSLLRINSRFARGSDPDFEFNFFQVVRSWLYHNYLKEKTHIYEFGCGPGHNLVDFAQRAPEKKLYGFDWTQASVNLVNKIAEVHGFNMTGRCMDMFHPDHSVGFENSNAVITMGALEQLGGDYHAFVEFLLEKSPEICVNIEPLVELYDENVLEDFLAIMHHRKRNLLGNYVTSLKELEAAGRIRILSIQRVPFGGALEEGWSYVVWQPVA